MQLGRSGFVALSLLSTAAYPLAPASAAAPACDIGAAQPLQTGTITPIEPDTAGKFVLTLKAGEGIIVDLDMIATGAEGEDMTMPEYSLALCDARAGVLEPATSQVFEKEAPTTTDGRRLRFVAEKAGRYFIAVAPASARRELIVRHRGVGTLTSPLVRTRVDATESGTISAKAPIIFSFAGTAGQWIEVKAVSEADTLLRLAAPKPEGGYALIAEDDDSDERNPVIRRRLPVSGTYFVQLASLSSEADTFRLSLKKVEAPKPPPPPRPLRVGAPITDRQMNDDDMKFYILNVVAGHSYQLEFNATYDGLLSVGLPNPIGNGNDSDPGEDGGFLPIDSKDETTTGIERMTFYARSSSQVMVRVKSYGLDDTGGTFSLAVTDLGE